ncbi:MAG: peptidoglycan DD-metalloendopeptidase family protein [Alkalimonas sp.]|uniref:Peptidoglycan DD-metalloendopeptidase family protein n=1 Tax=Alkalimonas delamerensis TaxID=265981 RepID=A0ABT9GQF3_9GAMM|nr:peptidoglycan DD-metalloendopeptidase family protein [Alkalimonas delamerensis]MCC5851717.1 peptidoglycan DD-metalloendopeptidase family protein [Alkalimonas sp.]MDP4529200.1 peptidoglycan DD-metalloendopeptidase family protein [Alkalimonas delamerensis]
MKDQLLISISSIHGSRHYSIGKLLRRYMLVIAAMLAVLTLATVIFVNYLLNQVEQHHRQQLSLQQHSEQLLADIARLEQQRGTLEEELAERTDEIYMATSRLGEIEQALGLDQVYSNNLDQRLDVATINSAVRSTMLQMIPSGSPLEFRYRSSRFGNRTHPIHGNVRHHRGVDLAANRGTPIYAPADGVVESVRPSNSGYGNMLKIKHAYGFATLYAHLHEFKVTAGSFVEKGQLIATVGNTGASTAPHLHYEVHFLDRPINPQAFMDWDATNFDHVFTQERSIQWDSLVSMLETKVSNQLLLSSHKAAPSMEVSD